jgi:hypothetical protein
MSTLPPAVHRAIVCVDVQGFGDLRRTNLDQVAIRRGLYEALRSAFDRSGVSWARCDHEDRGDGVLVLVPPEVPKSLLVSLLPPELAAALREHNQTHDARTQIQLRMAVHAGEIQYDGHGKTGIALNLAFRLLAADALKRALAKSSGVLAVIASEWFYDEVIVNTPSSDPDSFQQVHVSVKETATTAWISLPDDHYAAWQKTTPPVEEQAAADLPAKQAPIGLTHGSYSTRGPAGPTLARMVLAGRLRRMRRVHGWSRRDVGVLIGASETKIRRMELADTGSKMHDVASLLTLYGVTSEIERAEMLDLAARTNIRGWMHFYSDVLTDDIRAGLELEQVASLVRSYEPQFIPYLLQTVDYARTIMRIGNGDVPAAHIERWVSLLTVCQRIMYQPKPTRLWMIIDEAALYRGRQDHPKMMRNQLAHLIEIAELPHITIQIMPFDASGAPGGGIKILRLPERDLTQVACLEQPTSTIYLVEQADVDHYRQVMDRLGVNAATPAETRAILYRILRDD